MKSCFTSKKYRKYEQLLSAWRIGNFHKLKYHKSRVKSKMSVDLQMAKNIKLKGYNVLPSQIFYWQYVIE